MKNVGKRSYRSLIDFCKVYQFMLNKPIEIVSIRMRHKYLYKQNADILKEMIIIALEFINVQKQQKGNKLIEHYSVKPFSEISQYKILDGKGIELSNCW